MKSDEHCSRGLREEDILRLHNFIPVYSHGARADNPKGTKFLLLLNRFTTLIILCKF